MKENKTSPWNDSSVRWICEQHPTKDFLHKIGFLFRRTCAGPGMPEDTSENRAKGYIT